MSLGRRATLAEVPCSAPPPHTQRPFSTGEEEGEGEWHRALGSPGEAVSVSPLRVCRKPEVSAQLSAVRSTNGVRQPHGHDSGPPSLGRAPLSMNSQLPLNVCWLL